MDKHRHDLVILDDIMKGLKVFIMNKQGDFKKGDLSKWINIAINNLIHAYNTQQHYAKNLHDSKDEVWKIRQAWRDIVKYIVDKHGYHLEKNKPLPLKMYLDALHNTKGIDIRTVKKWTKLFKDSGYFKQISESAYEVLDSCYEFDSSIAEISEKQKEELK